jgi:hypothetical protein
MLTDAVTTDLPDELTAPLPRIEDIEAALDTPDQTFSPDRQCRLPVVRNAAAPTAFWIP